MRDNGSLAIRRKSIGYLGFRVSVGTKNFSEKAAVRCRAKEDTRRIAPRTRPEEAIPTRILDRPESKAALKGQPSKPHDPKPQKTYIPSQILDMLLLPINYGFLCALCAGNPDSSGARATAVPCGLVSSSRLRHPSCRFVF